MGVYEQLENEYEKLSDEEKRILFIYKSRLGLCINYLSNDNEMIEVIYNSYTKIVEDPKNFFMKMTVFKNISFDTFESFVESLNTTKQQIERICSKIELPEDITVFRAVSIPKDDNLKQISKGNIISTSIDINKCRNFFIRNESCKHYLYEIHLEKGTQVGICPYSILYDMNTKVLTMTKTNEQKEIIVLKDNIELEETGNMQMDIDGLEVTNIMISAKNKNNISDMKK